MRPLLVAWTWPCLCSILVARVSAQTLCATQLTCPGHAYLAAIRTPYYGKTWYTGVVPSGAHTLFTGNQTAAFELLCARAISTWTSLSDTLPHDQVGAAVDPFYWQWETQLRIGNMANRRLNIPL